MITREFQLFITNWLAKADSYSHGQLLSDFDRFFTLYVVFNKLYAEAFAILNSQRARKGERPKKYTDGNAATSIVVQYLGGTEILRSIEQDDRSREALASISDLISRRIFHFSLEASTGDWEPEKDNKLSANLRSDNSNTKATALLTILYRIRCNLFHGRKQFSDEQRAVLQPSNILLTKITLLLREKMPAR